MEGYFRISVMYRGEVEKMLNFIESYSKRYDPKSSNGFLYLYYNNKVDFERFYNNLVCNNITFKVFE